MFFGEEDHRARIRALQEQLAAQGLDAVVLTDEANIAYFAGYHPEHFFLTRSRMLALVVPATGAPIAVAPSSHARDVAEQTGLTHVIGYDDLRHAPVEDIGAALDELGAERVGMELGFEQRVNMTARDLEGLRRRVRAQIMDVTDAIWALRTVKSAAELALIERACRIGEQALDRCVPEVRAGDSEREVAARLAAEVALRGGRVAFLIITSGMGSYFRSNGAPRDRALRPDDFVFVDLGVRYGGYHADFNRNFVVGRPQPEQAALQDLVKEVTERAARHLVPGALAADVYARVLHDCRDVGLHIRPPGRIGHGLGLGVTEPPHISSQDPTRLALGLVTTIEPAVERADGFDCAECIYAVTAAGGRRLNRAGSTLEAAGGAVH